MDARPEAIEKEQSQAPNTAYLKDKTREATLEIQGRQTCDEFNEGPKTLKKCEARIFTIPDSTAGASLVANENYQSQ